MSRLAGHGYNDFNVGSMISKPNEYDGGSIISNLHLQSTGAKGRPPLAQESAKRYTEPRFYQAESQELHVHGPWPSIADPSIQHRPAETSLAEV